MAFLDETGLAELWSLVKAEDEKVTACKVLLDVTTTGSHLATYTLKDSIENYAALFFQFDNFKTNSESQTLNYFCLGTTTTKTIATIPTDAYNGSSFHSMCIAFVGNNITSLSGLSGSTMYAHRRAKSEIDDLTKVTLAGGYFDGIQAGATIKIWGLK